MEHAHINIGLAFFASCLGLSACIAFWASHSIYRIGDRTEGNVQRNIGLVLLGLAALTTAIAVWGGE